MTLRRHILFLLLLSLSVSSVFAGGPIGAVGPTPTKYAADRFPLVYRTDQGSLGSFSNDQATAIATFAFGQWDDLATAALSFIHASQLDRDVSSPSDPYISGLDQYTDGVFPVVFDNNGSITDARIGVGAKEQVFGFASSFSPDGLTFLEGFVILNGNLTVRENAEATYRQVITHEIGHMLGISHSQVSLHARYPLMYPTTQTETVIGIEPDDAAAMSNLYPTPEYRSSVGAISGNITNSIGAPLSGINVVAVDSATGACYSTVSDYSSGDDVTFLSKPDRTGAYIVQGLPPGRYFLRIEPINPLFTVGSQVASYVTPINTDTWHEWYNGAKEDGNMLIDNSNERTSVVVTAGNTTGGINIAANGSGTLKTLTEHNNAVSQEISLPFQPSGGAILSRFATRYTAPENGSVVGVRLLTLADSYMPLDASLTVSIHRDESGSLAGIPGEELGSVTVPFSELSADQYNDIWLRDLGSKVNFLQGEKFHIAVRVNGTGVLGCLLDDGAASKNQTSYYVEQAGRWLNFPDGLQGAGVAGWNLYMSAIYTSVPAGVLAPLMDVTPGEVKFGASRVGAKTTRQVAVRNVGTADLSVTNVLITGSDGSKFSIESGGGAFTLKPGEQRPLSIGFTPEDRPAVSALLQLVHNASGSPSVVNLSGSGKSPAIASPLPSIDFGEQNITTSKTQEPIVFRNGGTDSLRVLGLEVVGDGFSLASPNVPSWVGPAGSFKVRVSFRPTAEQPYSGMLRITHELSSSPIEIPLSGIGVASVGSVPVQIVAGGMSVSLNSVQPNPVHAAAEIFWNVSGAGRLPVEILVTDIMGREIFRESRTILGDGARRSESLILPLQDVPSGEYQVTIRSAGGSATRPFILMN